MSLIQYLPLRMAKTGRWRKGSTSLTVPSSCDSSAHTHLVTEPVIIAIRRNLAANHPIQHLLRPHHEGTFYINDAEIDGCLPRGA